MFKIVRMIISFCLVVLISLSALPNVAAEQHSNSLISGTAITDEEAYDNFIKVFGYSEEEAFKSVYETGDGTAALSGTWRTVTYEQVNATVTGQYKTCNTNGYIIDVAPLLWIQAKSGAEILEIDYAELIFVNR
ncbi:MAG: hypothetical protein FH749_12680 [Firmicutes bacterium]|nr:hypothetical protein [Bacillota bacterium]